MSSPNRAHLGALLLAVGLFVGVTAGAQVFTSKDRKAKIRLIKSKRDAGSAPDPILTLLSTVPSTGICDGGTSLSGVTFTRATAVSCTPADIGVVDLASGQLALESDGLLLERAAVNYQRTNEDFDTTGTWDRTNITTVANSTTAPNGASTADTMADTATNGNHKITKGPSGGTDGIAGSRYSFSAFVKANTLSFADLMVGVNFSDSAVNLSTCKPCDGTSPLILSEPSKNGWCRVVATDLDDSGAGTGSGIQVGDSCANSRTTYAGSGNSVYLWRAQSEKFTYHPTSPIQNTGTGTTTRNAATAYATNPIENTDTTWCIRAKVAPNWGRWTKEEPQGLWQLGTDAGTANTAAAWVTDAGYLQVGVWSEDAGVKTWQAQHQLTRWAHDLRVCNASGTITVYDADRAMDGGTNGSGIGTLTTQPSRLYIGSLGSDYQAQGRVMDVCVSDSTSTCASTATSAISAVAVDAGIWTNPYVRDEPEWCIRAPYAAQSEIVAGGVVGSANSFSLYTDGGYLFGSVWDTYSDVRTIQGRSSVSSASTVRLCGVRGEPVLFADDAPLQLPERAGSVTAMDGGLAIFSKAPDTIRAPATACFSRSMAGCGSRPNMILALGDSLTNCPPGSDSNPSKCWPQVLDEALGSFWGTRNYATGLANSSGMIASQWRPWAREAGIWSYVVLMGGLNDVAAGISGATAWANLLSLAQDAERMGARVIFITPTPWKNATTATWTAGKQTEYDALLTSIRTSGYTYIDAYEQFEDADPADQYELEPSYNIDYLDGVHLNQAAQNWIAAQVQAAMGL